MNFISLSYKGGISNIFSFSKFFLSNLIAKYLYLIKNLIENLIFNLYLGLPSFEKNSRNSSHSINSSLSFSILFRSSAKLSLLGIPGISNL